MATLRSILKTGALALLAAYGWLKLRLASQPVLLILTYHRILPASSTERKAEQAGMVTSPENFEKHICLIQKLGAQPVHLDDWLKKVQEGVKLPKLAFAITFDDGWRDNYLHAYPRLRAQKLPFTIFLVSSFVNTQRTFWPEQVIKILTSDNIPFNSETLRWLTPFVNPSENENFQAPVPLEEADEIITRLKSLEDEAILDGLINFHEAHPDFESNRSCRSILNSQELEEMAESTLVRYGAHTRNHFRLNRIKNDEKLRQEIVGCIEDIKGHSQAFVPIFCYPNGDITNEGKFLVSKHYQAACTTKTGWNRADCNPYELNRFNLHDGNSHSALRLLATIGRGLL